ncbi:DNA mismatch repair protein MutL [Macrolepiota fuliginosa MF-IS2]|uniref:DNA mismatch repair protein PMS1 n=1 Tax=Macrolepiota fuliginosa MF-IS2 TaxID=1400762 RepID=A0A9P5XD08_9AGAR|nr:DNA mismatch repair protein MutL [Macrolepiota fuliginosa MF-IS2]
MASNPENATIKPIDKTSIHRITSGQVVIDLQTAVKELVENSLDAGATNIEVRFKQYGLVGIEVVDNGTGIAEKDHDSIGLKHYTSKLTTYTDLTQLHSFGFRGEALSSLCALCQLVQVTTATHSPLGICLELEASGRVKSRKTVARPKGTTITLQGLFRPLPVRRKELERNIKREFAKALGLLHAYALLPCAIEPGVRLHVTNQLDRGAKSQLLATQGAPSMRASTTALWGPKALNSIVDLNLSLEVEKERGNKRIASQSLPSVDEEPLQVHVQGLISKFNVACGRAGTDRQFFYVNGRPCALTKVQKAFNEVYRSFNATQSPFVVADFILPTDACDVNVSPDKRTVFIHSEGNLIAALKVALEHHFNPARSTLDVVPAQPKTVQTSLDQVSMSRSGSTATSASRGRPRSLSPATGSNEHETNPPHPQTTSPSITNEGCDDRHDLTYKTPLFMPDPDDEPPSANPDFQSLSDSCDEPITTGAPLNDIQPPDSTRGHVEETVIDTTRAAWNRPFSSEIAVSFTETPIVAEGTEDAVKDSPQVPDKDRDVSDSGEPNQSVSPDPGSEDGPPRKKHKVGPDSQGVSPPWISTKPASIVGKARQSDAGDEATVRKVSSTAGAGPATRTKVRGGQLSMHQFLSGFASTSSQPQSDERIQRVEEVGAEEVLPQDVEMERAEEECRWSDPVSRCSKDPIIENDSRAWDPEQYSGGSPEVHTEGQEDIGIDDLDVSSPLSSVQQSILSDSHASRTEPISRPEIIRGSTGSDITVKFDLEKTISKWSRASAPKPAARLPISHDNPDSLQDAGLSNTEDEAQVAEILSRIIDKADFSMMEVVGQFNLGFIIARRMKLDSLSGHTMDDLFIVDQHAADEKYNFENLQQTTNIQSQKLFQPRPLEFTAADELVATENIDILRKNGFEIDVDENAPPGARLTLAAQPISKNTVFDMRDLEELLHLLRSRPNGQMVRCSKARAMFAMRACRKSIMIGRPLNRHQMQSVVRHMGTMDQPWNCPHGRPTMRHLVDLDGVKRQRREVDWKSLTTNP